MKPMERYTQGEEQRVILDHFGSQVGTFLDIGANDGRTFSNTYALSLLGWQGACVEPSPRAFAALKATHEGNERIRLINAAITTQDGQVTLHDSSDTLVSSLESASKAAWAHHGFDWNEIRVEGITVPTMLSRSGFTAFDFISIDAEGHDLEILRQMDLHALGCRMLCIEHGGRFQAIKELTKGYRESWRDQINLILVR